MRTVTKPVPDCSAWRYITVGNDDVLTDQTARQIVANDKDWLRLCGKPSQNRPRSYSENPNK